MFPQVRMRRLRENEILRDSLGETTVLKQDLILPLFIHEQADSRAIGSMPLHQRLSLADLSFDVENCIKGGINKFMLFGIPDNKDQLGTSAFEQQGIIQQAIRQLKSDFGQQAYVLADLCMCEYTDHGHCGLLEGQTVANDPTLEVLQKIATSYGQAGVDCVAPSGMMDGVISALRAELDANGYEALPILGYSAKFASAFYGPFRDACDSAPSFGDRRSYQMNPANRREALREVELDIAEGVDILMVKPALPYLDIIREVRQLCKLPLCAYNVSGEYSMIKAAAEKGWLDETAAAWESLLSIKRAGADLIISYWARDILEWEKQV